MFAGTAKAVLLAVVGALLVAVPTATAAEGVTPLRGVVAKGFDGVIGGTDVFTISQRKTKPEPKDGYTYTSVLLRTSLLDGSKTLIHKFDPRDPTSGFPEKILTGGGFVYVNETSDGPDYELDSRSAVLRMARDGSGLQKVAVGQLNAGEEDSVVIENGKGRLNDCGSSVAAELVTDDGSVVIRETISDRDSKSCGRKKNYDHVRFYVLSPAGIAREISIDDIRVKNEVRVHPDGSWSSRGSENYGPDDVDYTRVVSVVGSRALISHAGARALVVRDLNTGTETGPYKTGISGRYLFNSGSLDPLGRVAMNAYAETGSRKHRRYRRAAGVFHSPGSAAPFVRAKGLAYLVYCGNHLLSITRKGVRELDPVTLNLIRPIAPLHKGGSVVWEDNVCSNDYLYMSDRGGKRTEFLSYPLN